MKTYEQFHLQCIEQMGQYIQMIPEVSVHEDIETTEEYMKSVKSLKRKVAEAFDKNDGVDKDPDGLSEQLVDTLQFPEVTEIYEQMYQRVSELAFYSHHTTNRVQIVKSFSTNAPENSSWLWHYDDNAGPQYKLFIYLTDVGNDSGPFCYMASKDLKPYKFPTSKVSPGREGQKYFERSRVPLPVVESMIKEGASERYITGKAGKCFIFDPNIMHKATKPKLDEERIALIYHMHPTTEKTKMSNYVDKSVKHFAYK